MADIKEVILHLQILRTWAEVGPSIEGHCLKKTVEWIDDALGVLESDGKLLDRARRGEVLKYHGGGVVVFNSGWYEAHKAREAAGKDGGEGDG